MRLPHALVMPFVLFLSFGPAQPQPYGSRYNDPAFVLVQPAVRLLTSGAVKEALAELDRVQPEIAGQPLKVQAWASQVRGQVLEALGERAAAEQAADRGRALARQAGDPFIEFDSIILLVRLARARGDLSGAAALVAEAEPIADRLADDGMRFYVQNESGRIARARGRGQEALQFLNQAVATAERLEPRMQIDSLGSRSAARLGLSDYDGALSDARRAYAISVAARVTPDLRGAAAFGLAQVLSQVGDLERGLEFWTEALEAYSEANLAIGISLALRQRMDTRFALGDFEGAAADGIRARELFAKGGSQGQEPALLSRMALIEARLGRPDAAAEYARLATSGTPPSQPRVRTAIEMDLAAAALAGERFADATTRYTRVLEQGRALRDQDIEWRALHGLGRAALGAGDTAAARGQFEQAVTVVERMRRALPEAGLRADFVAERLGPYDGLIDALLATPASSSREDGARRAFDVSERARGRALADLLTEARARATDPAVAAVRAQEAEFGRRFSALYRSIAEAATPADRDRLVAALDLAEREYDALVVSARRNTPQYASLAHPEATSAAAVMASLAPDEALVSLWVGAERGVAWTVTSAGVRTHWLPSRAELDRQVGRLNAAIAGRQPEAVRRLGGELSATLFREVDFARVSRLVIVPDGPLWRTPFAALSVGPVWLIERTTVSLVPSASVRQTLSGTAARATARRGLVFGLEDVPESVRALRALYDERLLPARPLRFAPGEARNVASLISGDLFLNERADETVFKRAAEMPVRVVHVASHALIDDRVPRRSALILRPAAADDGLLQLNEIANLRLDADLVVLSTCQSQVGRAVRGEGLVSLSRAFIHSGARAVAASLWAVDDRETARLMPFFYAALVRGEAPDAALRTAQLRMIAAGGAAAEPSSWAAFVVMGRAGQPVF